MSKVAYVALLNSKINLHLSLRSEVDLLNFLTSNKCFIVYLFILANNFNDILPFKYMLPC